MKNKIAIYLMIVAVTTANFGCGRAASGKTESGDTNVAEIDQLAACGESDLAEAQRVDLIIASDEFAKAENYSCAEAVCDEFDRRFPEHFARFECRGNVLFKQNQLAQSLVYFDRLVAAKPNYSYGHLQRSFAHSGLRNLDEALADADAAYKSIEAEAEQDDTRSYAAKILVQRGYVQFLKSENELALRDYERAIELKPDGHLAYTARSFVRRKLGQNDLADADEKRGKELKQTNKEG